MKVYVVKKIFTTKEGNQVEYFQMICHLPFGNQVQVLCKDKQSICNVLNITMSDLYTTYSTIDYEYEVATLNFNKKEAK